MTARRYFTGSPIDDHTAIKGGYVTEFFYRYAVINNRFHRVKMGGRKPVLKISFGSHNPLPGCALVPNELGVGDLIRLAVLIYHQLCRFARLFRPMGNGFGSRCDHSNVLYQRLMITMQCLLHAFYVAIPKDTS